MYKIFCVTTISQSTSYIVLNIAKVGGPLKFGWGWPWDIKAMRLSSFTVNNFKSFDKHTRYYTRHSFIMNLKHFKQVETIWWKVEYYKI